MFEQRGWDRKNLKKGLRPSVESVYVTNEGHTVTVLSPEVVGVPGRWLRSGDPVDEFFKQRGESDAS